MDRSEGVAGTADRVLTGAVEGGQVPGLVALAADRRGPIYEGAFGRRQLDRAEPMTLDTVVWLASMTKAVTAVAALQLVEAGQVGLDEPLGPRLPALAAAQVLDGFEADGRPRLRPPRRPITLRALLTHTAGFAYSMWNADLLRLQERADASRDPMTAPMVFDPGDRWEYGLGIDWAGRLVEQVSGRSLEEYFRARILDPLGMADTSFELGPGRRARLAGRHSRQPDGSLVAVELALPDRPAVYAGGGGLYSTGPDYLRFLRMLLGGGELDGARVLRPETVAEMARNQIGALTVGLLRSTMPDRSNDVDIFPGEVARWGLGGLINTAPVPGGRSAGSWGWAGLANTYFWLDPSRGIAGLILTQVLPFRDRTVVALAERFERAVYAGLGTADRAGDAAR